MNVRLNLATKPLENARRFLFTAGISGAILLTLLFLLSFRVYHTWKANREMREEVGRLQDDLREFRNQRRDLEEFFKRDGSKRVMDRAAFLNGLIEERSFPWTRIFMDLEKLLPTGVRVISLAPRRESGRIELRLVIGARSNDGRVSLLKALEEAPQFSRVILVSETRKEDATGDDDPVRIELVAWYQADKDSVPAKPSAGPRTGAL